MRRWWTWPVWPQSLMQDPNTSLTSSLLRKHLQMLAFSYNNKLLQHRTTANKTVYTHYIDLVADK